jgi:hypothetical protein
LLTACFIVFPAVLICYAALSSFLLCSRSNAALSPPPPCSCGCTISSVLYSYAFRDCNVHSISLSDVCHLHARAPPRLILLPFPSLIGRCLLPTPFRLSSNADDDGEAHSQSGHRRKVRHPLRRQHPQANQAH